MNDSLYMLSRALGGLITAQIWNKIYPSTSSDTCPLKTSPSLAGTKLLETLLKVTATRLTECDTN